MVSVEARGGHLLLVLHRGASQGLVIEALDGSGSARALGGAVAFLPQGHAWRLASIGGSARAVAVDVTPGSIEHVCGAEALTWRPAVVGQAPRIADAVRWLQAADAEDLGNTDLVDRLLARLLATTFGGFTRRADDSWLPAAALGRISALLAGGRLGQLTSASLAADAGLGASAFARGFRGSTGLTPGDCLIEARLSQVASMLATTDLTLTEIARRVGLASVAHVSQQFGSRHGMSARRFRAANRVQPSSRRSDTDRTAPGRKVDR